MYALLQATNDVTIIKEIASLTKQLANKKNIHVNKSVDQSIGYLVVDLTKFKETLLMENATQFTPEGGPVTITTTQLGDMI